MAYCERARGVLNVMVDNVSWKLESDSDLNIRVSAQEREGMNDGEFSIKDVNPYIEGTFRVPPGFPVAAAQELCGVTVIAELYDGRVFVLQNAANVSNDPYNAKDGTLPLRFEGAVMIERATAVSA